jgi:hypothetical protein
MPLEGLTKSNNFATLKALAIFLGIRPITTKEVPLILRFTLCNLRSGSPQNQNEMDDLRNY